MRQAWPPQLKNGFTIIAFALSNGDLVEISSKLGSWIAKLGQAEIEVI